MFLMTNGAIEKFLGSNTGKGFKGFYDDLLYGSGYGESKHSVYILKGGPGTGKSTFIKKVGVLLEKMSCDVEFLRCSGDVNSFDGASSRMGEITVVDGTSPHCIDPTCPGVRESIINLGEFWDRSLLMKYSDKIEKSMNIKKTMYRKAYHYLAAANEVYLDRADILRQNIDFQKLERYADSLADELIKNKKNDHGGLGVKRRAFATAVTAEGVSGKLPGMRGGDMSVSNIYCIDSMFGISTEKLLKIIADRAVKAGYDVDLYYCGFDSSKLEHIVVHELDFMIVTSNEFHRYASLSRVNEIAIEGFMKRPFEQKGTVCCGNDIGYSRIRFEELIDRASRALAKASEAHGDMENYYVEAMDFAGLTQFCDFVLDDISAEVHNNIVGEILK